MGQATPEVSLTTGELINNSTACVYDNTLAVIFFIPEWKERVNSLMLQAEFGLVHLIERLLQV